MKWVTLLSFLFLTACGGSDHAVSAKKETITVQPHKLGTTLYYSGIVQPLKTVVITTPADGVVSDMAFHYGDSVASNQALFTISSDKFKTDYKNALMAYVKAKTDFSNNQVMLRESEFLHKNQLISDDDFKSKQTTFFNAQLALVQAKDALAIYLKQMDLKGLDLFSLSIENIDKINQVLHEQSDSQILRIPSPAAGVVLLPVKSDSNDGQGKKVVKGDQVKQGDVLAMIGDVTGLTININVSEFNVNQLKVGQKVRVTGTAFAEHELKGEISGIDRQGQMGQGGMPVFPVEIVVSKLTEEEQKIIHIGMSAKVEIQIDGGDVITVPIAAVSQKNGMSFVKVASGRKIQEVFVKTGQTTQNEVVIESNLKAGDQVVITD